MGRGKKIDDVAVVVDAAIGLIEKGGIEEFSTRRLAAALAVSAMTLYNYFADREAILKQVAIRCLGDFNAEVDRSIGESPETRLETGGNPMRAFKLLAERLLAFGVARPRLYLFIFDSSMGGVREDPEVSVEFDHFMKWILSLLGGRVPADELHHDVLLFELLANSLVVGAIRWPRSIDPEACREYIDRAYERLLSRYEAMLAPYSST